MLSALIPRFGGFFTNFVLASINTTPTAACSDQFVTTLVGGIGTVITVLVGIGIAIAVIGIVVGGLMRATAWGSDQRVAMSNKAITCAVIGLVIVLLGVTLGNAIPGWFGAGSCKVGS
jgi:hypothetical protein